MKMGRRVNFVYIYTKTNDHLFRNKSLMLENRK